MNKEKIDVVTEIRARKSTVTSINHRKMEVVDNFVELLLSGFSSGVAGRPPRIKDVADAAGLSVRTMQRQLASFGLSYSSLIDEVRRCVAFGRVAGSRAKIAEIAFDLGYSDAAHFTRAFRRWTGVSPREFRTQQE